MPAGTGLAQRPRPPGTLAGRRWRLWPNSSASPLFRRPKRREVGPPQASPARATPLVTARNQSPNPSTRNPFPQPATRNPQSILTDHSWRGNRLPTSDNLLSVGPPRCFVAHCPLSPGRACRSGTPCLSLGLIPPPSQNRPQSHHSIHPPIHPFIPSRPRLPPEALFSRRRHFAANTTACVRLTTTSRQDDSTNDSHSHRIARRIDDFDGRPSQSSPSPRTTNLAQPDDCATDPELRSTHRTTTSSTTTSPTPAPAVERRISPSARLDRHHDRSPSVVGPLCAVVAPCLVNILSRLGCSTMIELRQSSDVNTSPSTVSPVPSR